MKIGENAVVRCLGTILAFSIPKRRIDRPGVQSECQQFQKVLLSEQCASKDLLRMEERNMEANNFDILCLSHLRWDFVYQRPQHLLSRFARDRRVFFFEEPVFSERPTFLDLTQKENNLWVAVPHISYEDRDTGDLTKIQRIMVEKLIDAKKINDFILWFYTPMAMDFAAHIEPLATVFDCMDELSAFKFAPPQLIENEKRLMEKADLVFTGGQSLYEAKRDRHERVFAFPSSIDVEHFRTAREVDNSPNGEEQISKPQLGYCGVIDERLDLDLLADLADFKPQWQFVMIGPVVKISEDDLPRRSNIHYLGGKDYKDLPKYLAEWNIALMPFAMNEATKFISPTKTPEYLAAGKPVISTPVRDVVRPYYEKGLVEIAKNAEEFAEAGERILNEDDRSEWLERVDEHLSTMSWDKTWKEMEKLIEETLRSKTKVSAKTV